MKRIVLVIAIIAIMLSLGCKDETTTPTPINKAATPAEVVSNLSLAFDTGDYNLYTSCLSEDYTFYFSPYDVGHSTGDGYVIPESWSYSEDVIATGRMFRLAYSISLDIASSQIGTPEEGATEYTKNNVNIVLLVMISETDGLRAEGFVTFKFIKVNENGEDVWKIKEMHDYTTAKKVIESASLGQVKASFYSPPTQ